MTDQQPFTLYLNQPKWYQVDVNKLRQSSMTDAAYLFGSLSVNEDYEHFDRVKHLLVIPEEPKSLEDIQKELDDKIDAHIKSVKIKFEVSKNRSERNYDLTFDRIISNFEYAQNNGFFPTSLTISGTIGFDGSYLVSNGSGGANWTTSNFLIKPNARGVGYWEIQPNIQIWLNKKPTWIVRKCAKLFFYFGWNDAE